MQYWRLVKGQCSTPRNLENSGIRRKKGFPDKPFYILDVQVKNALDALIRRVLHYARAIIFRQVQIRL
jgi:hypothetical protein